MARIFFYTMQDIDVALLLIGNYTCLGLAFE